MSRLGPALVSADQSPQPTVTLPTSLTLLDSYTTATGPVTAGSLWRATDGLGGLWTGNGVIPYPVSPTLDVRAYGAVCDGSTDDSAAIQDAFDAATRGDSIYIPPNCAIASKLTFDGDGREGVKVYGNTFYGGTASLKWTGAAGGTMLEIIHARGTWWNLYLNGDTSAANGLLVNSDAAPGTCNNIFDRLTVIGCTTAGVTLDGETHAEQVSESLFIMPYLVSNGINLWLRSSNAQNTYCILPRLGDMSWSGPDTGTVTTYNVKMDSGALWLYGANFEGTKNTAGACDIYIGGFVRPSLHIFGAYSESTRRFLHCATQVSIPMSLHGVTHIPADNTFDTGETLTLRLASTSQVSLVGCDLPYGDITCSNDDCDLHFIGCNIGGSVTPDGTTPRIWRQDDTGWRAGGGTSIVKVLTGTATWNPGTLANGAVSGTDVTVTGAAVGDPCIASHNGIPAGAALITAYVRSANTVRVVIRNDDGGNLVVADGTARVTVLKY